MISLLEYTVNYLDLSCTLSSNDVESLSGWLSDNIIQFFGELLENNCKKLNSDVNIHFIHPVASTFLRENSAAVLDYFEFGIEDWILCPIHDSDKNDREGSHWSLLVISPNLKMSLYLDSLLSPSQFISKQLVCARQNNDIICSYYKWRNEFRIIPCVRQVDSDSCGVYTIFNMLSVCDFLLKGDLSWIDYGVDNCLVHERPENLRSILRVEVEKYLIDYERK